MKRRQVLSDLTAFSPSDYKPDSYFYEKDEKDKQGMITRSKLSDYLGDFYNTQNMEFFDTLPGGIIPQDFRLFSNELKRKVPFNLDYERYLYINDKPDMLSKIYTLFQFSQKFGGRGTKKKAKNKKIIKKKTVKKKGGMMRRGRPCALMDTGGFLSDDSVSVSPEIILQCVPLHARSAEGDTIMINAPQSPPPDKYKRDINVSRHFGAQPDQKLEYHWDMYIYDIINKGLTKDQKNLMEPFRNPINIDKVSNWFMKGDIPEEFELHILPEMTTVRFQFRDRDMAEEIISRCNNSMCILRYIFGGIILQRGSSYKNKIKKTTVKKSDVKKTTVKKSDVKKSKIDKPKVKKTTVKKSDVKKTKIDKTKVKKTTVKKSDVKKTKIDKTKLKKINK